MSPDGSGSAELAARGLGVDSVLARRRTTRVRRFRGQLFVATGTTAIELDEVGAFIFARVNGKASIAAIGAAVAAAYEVPVDVAAGDALELLEQLVAEGIVEPSTTA